MRRDVAYDAGPTGGEVAHSAPGSGSHGSVSTGHGTNGPYAALSHSGMVGNLAAYVGSGVGAEVEDRASPACTAGIARWFKKFLAKIDAEVPDGLDVHLVCDNYGTHKHPIIKAWLADHRVTLHFTSTYSSWLNLVERFFGYVTAGLLHAPTTAESKPSKADIRSWVKASSEASDD